MLLNFCLRTILWMACVFTPKLQVKLSSQFYSWSSITREETFRKFYRDIPYLNPFRLLTSLNSEPWTWQRRWRKSRVKTIEFWQLEVICITSERMLSSWHSPFKGESRQSQALEIICGMCGCCFKTQFGNFKSDWMSSENICLLSPLQKG